MKISMKEVLRLAAGLLGLGEDSVEDGENIEQNALLLRCGNLVHDEVASEYLPPETSETVTVKDGFLPYEALSERCSAIRLVTDANGNKVRFHARAHGASLANGVYRVVYRYLPASVGMEDNLTVDAGRLSARVLAYGVAAEYCLLSGLFQEAITWERKYRDSLLSICGRSTAMRLPNRRWAIG